MTVASDETTNHVVASTPGIGHRLQQARERKKLTIAEAASQLRFTRATVIHLEQEEWDKLHSRTYARGYLLNYVKFLGLPSDDMLAAFNVQYGETERPTNLLLTKTLPEEKQFPWLSSLLIVIVLAIAALVIQYWPQQGVNWSAGQESSTDSTLDAVPQAAPAAELLDDDIGIQAQPSNASDTRDVSKVDDEPVTPLMIDSMPAEMAMNEQQNLTDPASETAEIDAVEATVAASDEVTPENAETDENAVSNPGEALLRLEITEASWIEVKDNNGNTLISRVLEQETVDLTGPAPLSVRIGNVAGTAMRFNNKPVDLGTYQQNNVARLTLGDES